MWSSKHSEMSLDTLAIAPVNDVYTFYTDFTELYFNDVCFVEGEITTHQRSTWSLWFSCIRLEETISGSGILSEHHQPGEEDFPLELIFPLEVSWKTISFPGSCSFGTADFTLKAPCSCICISYTGYTWQLKHHVSYIICMHKLHGHLIPRLKSLKPDGFIVVKCWKTTFSYILFFNYWGQTSCIVSWKKFFSCSQCWEFRQKTRWLRISSRLQKNRVHDWWFWYVQRLAGQDSQWSAFFCLWTQSCFFGQHVTRLGCQADWHHPFY